MEPDKSWGRLFKEGEKYEFFGGNFGLNFPQFDGKMDSFCGGKSFQPQFLSKRENVFPANSRPDTC